MFRHVVMFKWAADVDAAHVAAVAAALDGLPGVIPELRSYRHGPDAGVSEGNFDYVVVADVDSVDDYVAYRDAAPHQAVVADFIAGRVSERAAVQYHVAD